MVSNQVLGARLAVGFLTLSFTLGGCALFRHPQSTTPPATAAPEAQASAPAQPVAAPAEQMTATEAAINAAGSQVTAAPAAGPAPEVNPTAPKHYTVKKGDTLWGIASMYLKNPWLWPEVWIINPQVPNPHLIYPGDTLALAYGAGGRPEVRLEQAGEVRLDPRLRSTALDTSIPAIPYSAIQGFLSHPTLLSNEQIRQAPYVLAFRDMHQVAGERMEIYVQNLTADQNTRYSVVHVDTPLRDPDDGARLGYIGIYTATALVERPGHPAKAMLIESARETVGGDRLLSADEQTPLNFAPTAPASDIHGRILAVVGGTDLIGQFAVVAINRGKSQGIQPGNVLAVDSAGDTVRDLYRNGQEIGKSNAIGSSFAPKVTLPDERTGTVLVFKVFDRMSYGLVVGASDTIHVLDKVHNP